MKRSRKDERSSTERPYLHLRCHNGSHLSSEARSALSAVALGLATPGKGITACDESAGTIGKRFEAVGVENLEENRRKYRQMLFKTEGITEYLCGAILDPETLTQRDDSGALFPEVLSTLRIIPGVKPHLKVYTLPGTNGDTVMQGLDSLSTRCASYYKEGARFTKWRSPLKINLQTGNPTRLAIESCMSDLARFALISQAEGLVPLVEPDVVLDGDHDLESAIAINTEIWGLLFHYMRESGVFMQGCILKVNMINPGKDCPHRYSVEEIAKANIEVMKLTVPAALPGINYLSGGQSLEEAITRLRAINKMKDSTIPYNLSFSWSACIQLPLIALAKGRTLDSALEEMSVLYSKELKAAAAAAMGK